MQKAQPTEELTSREQEIFDLLLAGSTPKEIGFKLKITYNTVAAHQKSIYRKLEIGNINELFVKYGKSGMLANTGQKKKLPLKFLIPAATVIFMGIIAFIIWLAPWKDPEFIINFWWPFGDTPSKTTVLKKNEIIDGEGEVNVVRISGVFNEGEENLTGIYGRPSISTLNAIRTKMKAISFKVLGDGNYYTVRFPTFETIGGDHYLFVFPTIENEISTVMVNIPEDLVRQGWSGSDTEFIQSNITFILFQPAQYGNYMLKIWDIKLHKNKFQDSSENMLKYLKVQPITNDQVMY